MDSPDLDQRLIRKAEGAIQKRTSRLTVVVERCTNDFNYSAILRTVEALGIQHVWIVDPPVQETVVEHDLTSTKKNTTTTTTASLKRSTGQVIKAAAPEEIEQRKTHHLFAQRAAEWLSVREFQTTTECIDELKATGHTIWATDLSQEAVCLTRDALGGNSHTSSSSSRSEQPSLLPEKLAIVFGTEAVGCTHEMLSRADQRVYLPLHGFADSLNLSVATALVVQQLFHLDPTLLGAMSEEERSHLRHQWFSKLATQRLLSSKDKKRQKRLAVQLQLLEHIRDQQTSGKSLQPEQLAKLNEYDTIKQEAHDLETFLTEKAQQAVKELVKNPPAPLSDMRRADEHRACYVGKKTKSRQGGQWDNMPATTGYNTTAHSHTNSSSDYFRGLAGVESHNEHGAAAAAANTTTTTTNNNKSSQ
mmetsp:Transcript_28299/g.43385  ORF Transcript_28299/g.43385 Transcript_28299/m.43385 type:complete len:418 (+) Transcript_28299:3-1256(+)